MIAALATVVAGGEARREMLVVVGAAGAPEYAEGFASAAGALKQACSEAGVVCTVVGTGSDTVEGTSDRDRVAAWIANAGSGSDTRETWLIYIGHGTWDGGEARWNLRGPDVTAAEIAGWLAATPGARPWVIVHGGSASAPFVPALSAPGRIVITATESGDEVNYARFGERFAAAIASPDADIDQDERTSLLEAFLHASRQAQLFYDESARMATEHAMIDDNGDGKGTPAEWFRGTRVEKRSEDGSEPDGALARRLALLETDAERRLTAGQRTSRDELERELEALRTRKAQMDPADYLRELEILLRKLSRIYTRPETTAEDT